MRDHTKLKVFELADRLAIGIYRETISFPSAEIYGSGFLEVAYGSARELQYQIGLSARLGYLDEKSAKCLDSESTALVKALNGLVRALAP
jgi:hypothetical protein